MITNNQKCIICDLYNLSDLLVLNYLLENNICNNIQMQELKDLLLLNYQLCCDPGYLKNEDSYHMRIRNLLSEFGISFLNGDAYIP